jgi:hypothetical protein
MPRFQMSSPDLAVAVVARLKERGYEAGVDVVEPDDTHSFVSAWTTQDNTDEDALPGLVLDLDPASVHTGDEANSGSHPDPSTQ